MTWYTPYMSKRRIPIFFLIALSMWIPGTTRAAVKTIVLTSGTSWTVPVDWNSTNNAIHVIGGGGGAENGGGGGGAYAKAMNVALTPSASVAYAVGAAGTSGATATAGGSTYFCDSTSDCASILGLSVVAGADGGSPAVDGSGGKGGSDLDSFGDVVYSGGDGGDAIDIQGLGGYTLAGGGGGAAGSKGPGGDAGHAGSLGGGGGGASGSAATSSPTLLGLAYYNVTFDVTTETTDMRGSAVHPDNSMYYLGDGSGNVYAYGMTDGDIGTAYFDSSFGAQLDVTSVDDIDFKPDGTVMYLVSMPGDVVFEYALSSPWDITTATSTGSYSFSGDLVTPNGIAFSSDGTKMYVADTYGLAVQEYALSSAWDVTTATYANTMSLSADYGDIYQISLYDGGQRMILSVYSVPTSTYIFEQFDLSTPWSITTATSSGLTSLVPDGYAAKYFSMRADASTIYMTDWVNSVVRQYQMGGGSAGGTGTTDNATFTIGGKGGGQFGGVGAEAYFNTSTYTAATAGTSGSGGGGGVYSGSSVTGDAAGANGSGYAEWTDSSGGPNNGQTFGSGGGGGGSGVRVEVPSTMSEEDGGDAGGYGAGGGGTADNTYYAIAAGYSYVGPAAPGDSTPGLIVITYESSSGGAPARMTRLLGNIRIGGNVRIW